MVVPFRSFSPIHDTVAEEAGLAFAPPYSGRKRVHNVDEMIAKIVAKRLVEHLAPPTHGAVAF
jgi:hypothetical protein